MKSKIFNYHILIQKEKLGKKYVFVSHVPSLGISDFGSTVDEALANTEKAIKLYIETLAEMNQPIPEEDEPDYILATKKISVTL